MPTLDLDFEIYCSCGNGMCAQSSTGRNGHAQYVTIEPCDRCTGEARGEGYEEGYAAAEKGASE